MRLLLLIFLLCLGAGELRAQQPMTYLTRDGAWRLTTDAKTVAKLKREGWMEMPFPEINPQTDCQRVWKNMQRTARKIHHASKRP